MNYRELRVNAKSRARSCSSGRAQPGRSSLGQSNFEASTRVRLIIGSLCRQANPAGRSRTRTHLCWHNSVTSASRRSDDSRKPILLEGITRRPAAVRSSTSGNIKFQSLIGNGVVSTFRAALRMVCLIFLFFTFISRLIVKVPSNNAQRSLKLMRSAFEKSAGIPQNKKIKKYMVIKENCSINKSTPWNSLKDVNSLPKIKNCFVEALFVSFNSKSVDSNKQKCSNNQMFWLIFGWLNENHSKKKLKQPIF